MATANFEQIKKLIEDLKLNDMEEEELYKREEPEEPREAMEALIRIGEPAVEPLIELLKNPRRLSCAYAIKILGEIKDNRAIKPLLEILDQDERLEIRINDISGDMGNLAVYALQKIGLPALEPALSYIKENWNNYNIVYLIDLLKGFKGDRAFDALVTMLSHPDENIIEFAADGLGEYGDPRAVEHLIRLLNFEERNAGSQVLDAINHLVDLKRYRSILKAHKELGLKLLESHKNRINSHLRDLERLCEGYNELKGDNAQEINDAVSEYFARKAVWDLLLEAIWLGATEGIIPEDMYKKVWSLGVSLLRTPEDLNEKLGNLFRSFPSENSKIWEKYGEEITFVVDRRYPSPIKTVKRSYRGLARNIELAKNEIHSWLKEQGFEVLISGGTFWARKSKDKSCFIYIRNLYPSEMDGKRIYGEVTIRFCGSLWNNEEINSFEAMFWGQVENTLKKLLRKGEKVEYR